MVFRLQSPAILRTYDGTEAPGQAHFESWILRDKYSPPEGEKSHAKYGQYRLLIESDVSTVEQVNSLHFKAITLAERIVRIWPYALGRHFESPSSGLSIELVEPPKGWESNSADILRDLRNGEPERSIHFNPSSFGPPIRWTRASWWPLSRITAALARDADLSELEQELLAVHAVAHGARSGRAFTVLLSTGLELALELLPGASKAEKDALIVAEAGDIKSSSLSALWRSANSRRQTRHSIAKGTVPALHPKMDPSEREAYIADVDAVIRFVLCRSLGLDFVAVSKA